MTDCDWYSAAAPAVSRFTERWGPGADNEGSRSLGNEDGVLKLAVHTPWPPPQQIMVATAPEMFPVEKRLFYTVRGDGKVLAEGKFGAWILGSADIDVPLDGVKQLELETRTELSKQPTLFWANARVVTKDDKEIPLGELQNIVAADVSPRTSEESQRRLTSAATSLLRVAFENIAQPNEAGKDFFGGPVKIVGNEYKIATSAQPTTNAESCALICPALVRCDSSPRSAEISRWATRPSGGKFSPCAHPLRKKRASSRSLSLMKTGRW